MTFKKLSIIRQQGHAECPFGLPIPEACKNAGEAIHRMAPLDFIEADAKQKYADANKKVYLHHKTGERCPYADKIVEGTSVVNCDFGDGGEGMRDAPMRPSPYYPRVFNGLANNAGGGMAGLFAHPLNAYWENMEAQQLFSGMLTMFASDEDVEIRKDAQEAYEEFMERLLVNNRGGQ